MTRALVTQMLEVLEKLSDTEQTYAALDKADAVIKTAREYLATEPSGERADSVQWLREFADMEFSYYSREATQLRKAADMLEADSKQKETENEQQVRSEVAAMGGQQPMEVSGDCSRDNFSDDDRALVASMVALLNLDAAGCLAPHGIGGHARRLLQASITRLEADAQPKQVTCQIYGHVVGACVECNTHIEAQQDKRVPMDDEEISEIINRYYRLMGPVEFARAIEAHHGITPADKPADDEPEDLYALALKADNWGQP